MTAGPIHPELRDAIAAEAVDALDGEERERLVAHLAGCEACRAELAELRASAAMLALTAPVRPMDPARSGRVRARLLARAAAERPAGLGAGPGASVDGDDVTLVAPPPSAPRAVNADDTTVVAPPPPDAQVIPIRARRPRPGIAPWLAMAAALALLLGTAAYALSLRGRLQRLDERYAAAERERSELARRVQEREAMLAAISGPNARVIEMAAARPAAPSGRMFWDQATDRWTFFAHNLPAVRAGREYQLWLVTADDRKISAGTFRPDARGAAVVQATYALSADALAAVAVTEEPAGGVPQPTGDIIIVGSAE